MAKRPKAGRTDDDDVMSRVRDDVVAQGIRDPNGPPLRTAEELQDDAEEANRQAMEAHVQSQRQQRVDSLNVRKQELEQQLQAIENDLANAEADLDAEVTPLAALPKCLPQFDPTLRSARTTAEGQTMVRVSKDQRSVMPELSDARTAEKAEEAGVGTEPEVVEESEPKE